MLDITISPVVSQDVWNSLDCVVKLPFTPEDLFQPISGSSFATRRSHKRLPMFGRAVMLHNEKTHGIYTKELSIKGIGFYSPVQLLPMQIVQLAFQQWEKLTLQVLRCHREQEACFLCGSCFLGGPLSIIDFRDFLRATQQ